MIKTLLYILVVDRRMLSLSSDFYENALPLQGRLRQCYPFPGTRTPSSTFIGILTIMMDSRSSNSGEIQ